MATTGLPRPFSVQTTVTATNEVVRQNLVVAGNATTSGNAVVGGTFQTTGVTSLATGGGATSTSGPFQIGDGNIGAGIISGKLRTGVNNVIMFSTPAPTLAVSLGTILTATQLSSGLIQGNPVGGAINYQLPTPANMLGLFNGVGGAQVGDTLYWSVENINADGANKTLTVTANGNSAVSSANTMVVLESTAGRFMTRITDAGVGNSTTFRIA